jgi:hypothetical protein
VWIVGHTLGVNVWRHRQCVACEGQIGDKRFNTVFPAAGVNMRAFPYLLVLSVIGIAPAVSVQAAENRCAYLEAQGDCICAIPQEWVQNGVVAQLTEVTGDVMVTVPAGFSSAPGADGNISLGDPSTVLVPGNGGATLVMGMCKKELPKNETVYVDKKGENCECAHLAQRGAVIPWLPAAGVAATTGIVIVVTSGGSPGSE